MYTHSLMIYGKEQCHFGRRIEEDGRGKNLTINSINDLGTREYLKNKRKKILIF